MRATATKCLKQGLSARNLRQYSCKTQHVQQDAPQVDIEQLLAYPTWSATSLLPQETPPLSEIPEATSKQLHHLLRLSALPPPSSPIEESRMLQTLSSQLHFVKDIQEVDTTGVEPLRSVRDETSEGEREAELGMKKLEDALGQEEVEGRLHRRLKRRQMENIEPEAWDVLGGAERRVGRFFVVEGGKT